MDKYVVHVTDDTIHDQLGFLTWFAGAEDSKGKPVHAESAEGGHESGEESGLFGKRNLPKSAFAIQLGEDF